VIDTEHLLLGVLRESPYIRKLLPSGATAAIRAQVGANKPIREKFPTSVVLPLSRALMQVLKNALEEADALKHSQIGAAHLFLALLREKDDLAARMLEPLGVQLEQMRTKVAEMSPELVSDAVSSLPDEDLSEATVSIRGLEVEIQLFQRLLARCRERYWLWREAPWRPRDCVIERSSGRISLDLSLAQDATNFELIKNGWKKDLCMICRWELYESADDAERGTGYTNGRDWLCLECYGRFGQRIL
jgi:hypothetical protein